jgi:hypothetical protein
MYFVTRYAHQMKKRNSQARLAGHGGVALTGKYSGIAELHRAGGDTYQGRVRKALHLI